MSDEAEAARHAAAWTLGIAGLLAYNWWVLVPLVPGLMRSPSELFSNMEVTGQPYATAMQHADLASGLLLAAAFLAVGSKSILAGRREWAAMMVFAVAGALGGVFPEVCADQVNAACRSVEWKFQLPVSQYLHMATGIVEFCAITIAVLLAFRRTRDERSRSALVYRNLTRGAFIAYPVLGVAYLLDRLGGLVEPVFFLGFTVMVLTQLAERTGSLGADRAGGTSEREAAAGHQRTLPAFVVRSVRRQAVAASSDDSQTWPANGSPSRSCRPGSSLRHAPRWPGRLGRRTGRVLRRRPARLHRQATCEFVAQESARRPSGRRCAEGPAGHGQAKRGRNASPPVR